MTLPGRAVVQVLPEGAEHRTGIWIENTKARRDPLDRAQLAALAALAGLAGLGGLGVDWARC
ncbi:hypothetical protein [Streptomyces sp. NPDC051364]|uniref:hypothetical protein n=1 Tax=Streptomyces sp. NPDC051364 TaxID=3155799 RepID=UPI0034350A49